MRQARCALISVHDKKGVADFARGLSNLGIRIISTGGTAEQLRKAGIPVTDVAAFTGQAEALGGRVKTLHPKIHAGILASRESEAHRLEMEHLGWDYIDLVAVNLTMAQGEGVTDLSEFMDTMDIGGHALLRAAAKNFRDVIVVCNPARYTLVLDELARGAGIIPEGLRARLAREALEAVACCDAVYHRTLYAFVAPAADVMPVELRLDLNKIGELRYGENPHQRAAVYRAMECGEPSVVESVLLSGKALSFNNYIDLDTAFEIVKEFRRPACAIVKHANPCGVAVADAPVEAYRRARATDQESAYGGIAGFNAAVDEDVAAELSASFIECVIAPAFTGAALEALKAKRNLRILEVPSFSAWLSGGGTRAGGREMRSITGGMLLQERDLGTIGLGDITQVTEAKPSAAEAAAVFFAWTVVKHVRSNAIVIASEEETVGIGAGQMSRVDAARLAVYKAKKPVEGCVAASDGFFTFRDAIDELARAGVKTIVQPGGSKMDGEIIAACNELGVAMVFTGMRCFKH
ncbi:MAG: bifunctional phosphoribosylaminoimidazolecarboxamide formyltransferase/IMP cyclohydrolase [Candidatus Aureabacteria bacterium]|nr:bifunctional phosphoribosylaminoimidazolecarboxamide formyltransferase/IMP cyclohydrolase [Candidatus Auribacterota bacterium]